MNFFTELDNDDFMQMNGGSAGFGRLPKAGAGGRPGFSRLPKPDVKGLTRTGGTQGGGKYETPFIPLQRSRMSEFLITHE